MSIDYQPQIGVEPSGTHVKMPTHGSTDVTKIVLKDEYRFKPDAVIDTKKHYFPGTAPQEAKPGEQSQDTGGGTL